MDRSAELADLAGLLADRTRAAFCLALLDGRAWTAGELAAHAGVAASTASEHLGRLVAGGLLAERRQGRHRYLQLAGPDTAELLEALGARLAPRADRPSGLRASRAAAALAMARTCYDHLAGRLGVAVTDAMTDRELLTDTGLTEAGETWFADALGAEPGELRATRRPVVRFCLDWTERRSHLAGSAGAVLCRRFLAKGWTRRASGRAIRVTPEGSAALRDLFGLDAASLSV